MCIYIYLFFIYLLFVFTLSLSLYLSLYVGVGIQVDTTVPGTAAKQKLPQEQQQSSTNGPVTHGGGATRPPWTPHVSFSLYIFLIVYVPRLNFGPG